MTRRLRWRRPTHECGVATSNISRPSAGWRPHANSAGGYSPAHSRVPRGRTDVSLTKVSTRRRCLPLDNAPAPREDPPRYPRLRHRGCLVTYREPLSEGCPPVTASSVPVPLRVFRLVRTNPPTHSDFRSQRAQKPNAAFSVDECRARGLSVFLLRRDARRALRLPNLRDHLLCEVNLPEGAGQLLHTGPRSHHTLWPFRNVDILSRCTVEAR